MVCTSTLFCVMKYFSGATVTVFYIDVIVSATDVLNSMLSSDDLYDMGPLGV